MQVERGAEAVNEDCRTGACLRLRAPDARAQVTLALAEEEAQGRIEDTALVVKVVAQPPDS